LSYAIVMSFVKTVNCTYIAAALNRLRERAENRGWISFIVRCKML